ncbi:Synaptotagmin-like protein 4 [Fukomys damarensis]|uniref:Synaptotagmin-like protein 4 n=1 Tax=Fukomys damarensis TaxID=885580 RepID=A0A091D5Z5_FUKDA|nr:Synaptotagmin-like protein 4 [Fukomys damarensis]
MSVIPIWKQVLNVPKYPDKKNGTVHQIKEMNRRSQVEKDIQPVGHNVVSVDEDEMISENTRKIFRPSEYTKSVIGLHPEDVGHESSSTGDRRKSVPGLSVNMEEEEVEEEEEEDIDHLLKLHRQKQRAKWLRHEYRWQHAELLFADT